MSKLPVESCQHPAVFCIGFVLICSYQAVKRRVRPAGAFINGLHPPFIAVNAIGFAVYNDIKPSDHIGAGSGLHN